MAAYWRFLIARPVVGLVERSACRRPSLAGLGFRQVCASFSMLPQHTEDLHRDAVDIFHKAVDSVLPPAMVKKAMRIESGELEVDGRRYPLNRNVHIVGFGKAVLGMARQAEELLGEHVVGGVVSIPTGMQEALRQANRGNMLLSPGSKLTVYEGASNNIPDANAQEAAMAIYDLAKSLGEDDLCLTLITGGGSALLPAPNPPLTLEDLAQVTQLLSRSGASIEQLNVIRKKLELLKGGGLATAAHPAKVISLVLSDVIGNSLEMIASGPTVPGTSSAKQCLNLFSLLGVKPPDTVRHFLEEAINAVHLTGGNPVVLPDTHHVIVGSNEVLVNSAVEHARHLGYITYVLSHSLGGSTSTAGEMFADIAAFVCLTMGNKRRLDMRHSLVREEMDLLRKGVSKDTVNQLLILAEQAANQDRPICVLATGETTVNVRGSGMGGRNQEMALTAAIHLHENDTKYDLWPRFSIGLLSGGTDGQDGPTQAAGAYVDTTTWQAARDSGLDPLEYLGNNDSYNFFSRLTSGSHHIITGFTGTNVMDLQVLLIRPTPRTSLDDP